MPELKTDKNQEIYKEYINSDTNYEKLARKHNLSTEEVKEIIKYYKTEDLERLIVTDIHHKREKYKNLAVELGLQGNFDKSITMLNDVLNWDRDNKNARGLFDATGHLLNVYRSKYKVSDKSTRLDIISKKEDIFANLSTMNAEGLLDKGQQSMLRVQEANMLLLKADEVANENKRIEITRQAIDTLIDLLSNLPGSDAHKLWPLNKAIKAMIDIKDYSNAKKYLNIAHSYLIDGYKAEVGKSSLDKRYVGNDQAIIKINYWMASLYANYAHLNYELENWHLAKIYAYMVLAIKTDENTLFSLHKQMNELLNEL